MKTITNIFSSDERFPLYQPYGPNQTTIAFISLNLETGDVDAEYKIQNSTSIKNWNNVELHFNISGQSTTDEINRLIDKMSNDLAVILNDSSVEWDGSNWRGQLGENAQDIYDRLGNFDYDNFEQQTFIIDDLAEWLQDVPEIKTTIEDLAADLFNCDGDNGYYFSDALNSETAIQSALLYIWADELYSGNDLGQKEAAALVAAGTCEDSQYTNELTDFAVVSAEMTYKEMYEEAAENCRTEDGYYFDGYSGGNALSMYVYQKYNVNAADNTAAKDALCDAI